MRKTLLQCLLWLLPLLFAGSCQQRPSEQAASATEGPSADLPVDTGEALPPEIAEEGTEALLEMPCSVAVKGYNNYVSRYIEVTQQLREEPKNEELQTQAAELKNEAQMWMVKASQCSADSAFAHEWARISERAAKELSE